MAKKKSKKLNIKGPLDYVSLPYLDLDPDTKRGIFIMLILAFGAISLLSLFDLAGMLGSYLERLLELLFGWGRWFFPVVMLAVGYLLYHKERRGVKGATYLGIFIFILSIHALFHLFIDQENWRAVVELGQGGGYLGLFLASTFMKILGFWASLISLFCLLLISFMLIFNKTISAMFGRESFFAKLFYPFNFVLNKLFKRGDGEEKEDEPEEEKHEEEEDDEEGGEGAHEEEEDFETPGFNTTEVKAEPAFMKSSAKEKEKKPERIWKANHVKIDVPFDLLSAKIGKPTSGDIKNNISIIKHTLENFGIPVEMDEVTVGPTVTQFTFKPAEGIKLSRITTLSNDLALALAAHPIRIEAPIPGKSLVGIEVPNQAKAIVGLREILEAKEFKERKSNLMIALGKDVAGKAWLYELPKMPHLLVAGQTNSGKSVCLNSLIVSLLYQNNPDDLRFIMVDPKRVELTPYNGIPHLLTPVITDVGKTINALKWCLNEMDRRFELLSTKHKRNIQSYNETSKEKMPYIVFIIDELADLMVAASKDIEGSVIRLSQMARAVGIHLVLATQRPSVDVITGLIKANMPARIAFSVASGVDSKTILDSLGAEKLLGKGDMLFTTAEESKPRRIQGAFVGDNEIKRIVGHVKERGGEPEYIEGITERQKVRGIGGHGLEGFEDGDSDELLGEAKELVINAGKASTSYLQRRLSVGYSRAAKLIDLLEEIGVVGAANGSKPREILISKEQYEAMISTGVSGVSLHRREEAEAPESYLPEEELNEEEESEEEGENDDNEPKVDLEEVYSGMDDNEEEAADEVDDMPVHASEPKPKKPADKNYHDEDTFDKLFSR